jgi:adenylate cyclase, class 2
MPNLRLLLQAGAAAIMATRMSSGGVETEIKLPVADPNAAIALLTNAGFSLVKPRTFESNIIFDTPANHLRSSGCVLRVRRAGEDQILTFKGPADRRRHKSREEIEIAVSDASKTTRILGGLGYYPQFRYEKYRTEFARQGESGLVTLDETPVGCFLELEGQPDWIDKIARDLGFDESHYITASYGTLYVRHCQAQGVEPSDMVFQHTSSERSETT